MELYFKFLAWISDLFLGKGKPCKNTPEYETTSAYLTHAKHMMHEATKEKSNVSKMIRLHKWFRSKP